MTSESQPSFSIVIPTYNRSDVLARTVRHLALQDYPSERYELVVVDNSIDETPDVARRTAAEHGLRARVLRLDERLPAVKRNVGLDAADGEYVLFMNDDVWAEPDLLTEHAQAHAMHPATVAVLGRVEQSPEMAPSPFAEWYRPFSYQEIAGHSDCEVDYRFCWSINLSFSRREMLDHGLRFHEDWAEIGHEDVELGFRWTSSGRRIVYNPRALAWHYHPHSLDSACRLQESIGRGLRDLEALVPDERLLERYGVFSWANRPQAVARGLLRQLMFNDLTVPLVQRWANGQKRNTQLTRWLYWKIMLHYTNRGYRRAPRRVLGPNSQRAPSLTAETSSP